MPLAIGADSLGYISIDGMIGASEQPSTRLCAACFDGNYPIPLPKETAMGKSVLEKLFASASGLDAPADDDNVSALSRP